MGNSKIDKTTKRMPASWNPWHGCTKISPGCMHCYMYRSDAKHDRDSTIVAKTSDFDLPIRKKRDGSWKIPSGSLVWTCFTSDFLHKDADVWRDQVWNMIRTRRDLYFFFITKRIDRLIECVPVDWGNGWDNVEIACTVENQDRANYRLPIYAKAPVLRKTIICEPLLEDLNLLPFLQMRRTENCNPCNTDVADTTNTLNKTDTSSNTGTFNNVGNASTTSTVTSSLNSRQVRVFQQVVVGGESGLEARVCNYDWILNIRQQCLNTGTAFTFRQTGAHFLKNDKLYTVPRKLHLKQAKKANINYKGDPYTEDNRSKEWKRNTIFTASRINAIEVNQTINNTLQLEFF